MVRRKTIKHKRKTIKKMGKRSSRIKRRSKRKNKNTKRKLRGGVNVKEEVEKYERRINPKFSKENNEEHIENEYIENEDIENEDIENEYIENEDMESKGEEEQVIEKENVDVKIENKEKILKICLDACRILQPFIQAVYEVLNFDHFGQSTKENIKEKKELFKLIESIKNGVISDVSKKKLNPNDVFTITDGMVQYIIRNYLFNDPKNFVGEETIEVNEISDKPGEINYTLKQGTSDADYIPPAFNKLIRDAINQIKGIAFDKDLFDNYTIFVDPIDGTAEYQGTDRRTDEEKIKTPFKQKGEQATIIIGFADKETKKSVGGTIYRPVKNDEKLEQFGTFVYGWVIDENDITKNVYGENLNMNNKEKEEGQIRFITSNGSITKPTKLLIEKIGGHREGSGGAGNKIMMLLEDKGDVYLQDRGVSRWDTCAGDAILRCKGGLFCKLTEFEKHGDPAQIDPEIKPKVNPEYTYTTKADDILDDINPNNNVDENKAAKYHDQNSLYKDGEKYKEYKEIKEFNELNKKLEKKIINKDEYTEEKKLFIKTGLNAGNIHHNSTNNLCGLVAITGEKRKEYTKKIFTAIKDLPINKSTRLRFDYD